MRHLVPILLCLGLALLPACGGDDEPDTPAPGRTAGSGDGDLDARVAAAIARGRAFLLTQQGADGSFGDTQAGMPGNAGFTAMAVTAVIGATSRGQVRADADVKKALDYLVAQQDESGAVLDASGLVNYHTSALVNALAASRDPAYRKALVTARDYLVQSQIATDESDPSYGGFPYKQEQGQPSDLSNSQFTAEALENAELPADHVVWKRLGKYLTRVQNYSEVNTEERTVEEEGETLVVVAGNDGGGVYGPGMSKAGRLKRSDGKYELRSYGSMTYALLKCLLFAGVGAEDARVKAAVKWIAKNFTVERNPGFEAAEDPEKAGQQGLYYYYYTAARALAEYEKRTAEALAVTDANGVAHDWRAEIAEKVLALQQQDGSWQNPVDRWMERSKTLSTSYALQTLAFIQGRLP